MSDQTQHTPGPWIKQGSGIHAQTDNGAMPIAQMKSHRADGTTAERNLPSVREMHANAALIAAAPELLAALSRLTDAAASRENTMGDPIRLLNVQAELRDATTNARAAIAKATSK